MFKNQMNMKLKQTWIFDTDIVKRTLMLVIWNASMIPFFYSNRPFVSYPSLYFKVTLSVS